MDSPFEIVGHGTDVSEIAYSMSAKVRELFPEDKMPAEIDVKQKRLTETLAQAEEEIQEFIGVVSRYVAGGE
jgi:hypothetical protein